MLISKLYRNIFTFKPKIVGKRSAPKTNGHYFKPGEMFIDKSRNAYPIIRHLGSGAAGEAYLVKDLQSGKNVVLKYFPHDISAADQTDVSADQKDIKAKQNRIKMFITSFNSEIDALQNKHPNIVTMLDFQYGKLSLGDILDNPLIELIKRPYIIQEYIDGGTIEYLSDSEIFNKIDVLRVVQDVAEALNFLSGQPFPLIHRDLSPANIMMTRGGQGKLIDFGLAKFMGGLTTKAKTQVFISAPGKSKGGTTGFISPEQQEGKEGVDHRSDIYSLGCVLYFMLSGNESRKCHPPEFELEFTDHDRTRYQETDMIRNKDIPDLIWRIIEKACQKDRDARYSNYSELISDLKAARMYFEAKEQYNAGQIDLAYNSYHRVLSSKQIAFSEEDRRTFAEICIDRGKELFGAGEFRSSWECLKEALESAGETVLEKTGEKIFSFLPALALALIQNGEIKEACEVIDKALIADRSLKEAIYILRGLFEAKETDLNGALQNFKKALQLDPSLRHNRIFSFALQSLEVMVNKSIPSYSSKFVRPRWAGYLNPFRRSLIAAKDVAQPGMPLGSSYQRFKLALKLAREKLGVRASYPLGSLAEVGILGFGLHQVSAAFDSLVPSIWAADIWMGGAELGLAAGIGSGIGAAVDRGRAVRSLAIPEIDLSVAPGRKLTRKLKLAYQKLWAEFFHSMAEKLEAEKKKLVELAPSKAQEVFCDVVKEIAAVLPKNSQDREILAKSLSHILEKILNEGQTTLDAMEKDAQYVLDKLNSDIGEG